MAKKQYLALAGLTIYDEKIKSHIEDVVVDKADKTEVDAKLATKSQVQLITWEAND